MLQNVTFFCNMYFFIFQSTMELAKTHASDPAALKVIFSSIVLECKIFYSLNFQVSNHITLRLKYIYIFVVIYSQK